MAHNITITAMTSADLDAVYALQCSAYPAALHEDVSLFRGILEGKNSLCFIAKIDGELAGYIFSYPSKEKRGDFEEGYKPITGDETALYLHDLCISPDRRGLKLAQKLADAVEQGAIMGGYKKIIAVSIDNAIQFWTKRGFKLHEPCTYCGEAAHKIEKIIS